MKTVSHIIGCLLMLGVIISCKKEDEIKSPDIGLEQSKVIFPALADSVLVKTKYKSWHVTTVYEYIDTTETDVHSYSYRQENDTISEDWFTMYKVRDEGIFVKVNENMLGKERKLLIFLATGNIFGQLVIIQNK